MESLPPTTRIPLAKTPGILQGVDSTLKQGFGAIKGLTSGGIPFQASSKAESSAVSRGTAYGSTINIAGIDGSISKNNPALIIAVVVLGIYAISNFAKGR